MPKRYYKQAANICLLLWLSFIAFLVIDGLGYLGEDIGVLQTLQTSSLARGMFYDIGLYSTIAAVWIYFSSDKSYRFVFAILTMFVGSGALLPYLYIHFRQLAVQSDDK